MRICCDIIPCFYRALRDGYCEMTSTLNIDVEILEWNPLLYYKYTVFSPKAVKEEDCYEYLHDYSGDTNRCLRTSSEKYRPFVHHGGLLVLHLLLVT